MDCSPEYIKMCGKAVEIQGLRVIKAYNRSAHKYEPETDMWLDGDWFWAEGEIYIYGGDSYSLSIYDGKIDLASAGYCEGAGGDILKVIWLPHQGQLQKMISDSAEVLVKQFYKFAVSTWAVYEDDHIYRHFCTALSSHYANIPLASMEQLWMAFVMKENYGKIWNGEDWIKE